MPTTIEIHHATKACLAARERLKRCARDLENQPEQRPANERQWLTDRCNLCLKAADAADEYAAAHRQLAAALLSAAGTITTVTK